MMEKYVNLIKAQNSVSRSKASKSYTYTLH